MTEEECEEADREFVQYYHRRICWLALREFPQAVADADHTLGMMDFCRDHSPDEQWTLSHEQYRPFVLFHRTQAAALSALGDNGAEAAVEEITKGLDRMKQVFVDYEAEEEFDEDELVQRLVELRESLRQHFRVGRTLQEQLADAIANEKYELAAEIRDELNRRDSRAREASSAGTKLGPGVASGLSIHQLHVANFHAMPSAATGSFQVGMNSCPTKPL